MKIINQEMKQMVEDCKKVARAYGLRFTNETLEYIVTNANLIELSPKGMIPTLYNYWVHDVDVIKGKGIYEAYPSNPYETVINTRPGISFYNINNPHWVNIFIVYHVLAHLDFFDNNMFFQKTWDYDFCGKALSDKRIITEIRETMGAEKRWVDYVIEFARSIDNLAGYYPEMSDCKKYQGQFSEPFNFYFDHFLKKVIKKEPKIYLEEMNRYNALVGKLGDAQAEKEFFKKVTQKHVDFNRVFENFKKNKKPEENRDVMQYIMNNSEFINKEENEWMKSVINIVRDTSIYFGPQIRTKIMNEGWASYWHEKMFLQDEKMSSHEVAFSGIDASVTMIPRAGLNPYGLGKRLLTFIEDLSNKGKLSYDFEKITDENERKRYNKKTGKGQETLFEIRKYFNDYRLFSFLSERNFQDFVKKNNLFVAGKKLNMQKRVWEYYVKSLNGEDYRNMVIDSLYHPPYVTVSRLKARGGELYLDHQFEGKQLVQKHIPDVMRGLVYLWGKPVNLETTVFTIDQQELMHAYMDPDYKPVHEEKRVLFYLSRYKDYPKMSYV